ncbi:MULTISPECIES: hypothetical protein [Micromonospora]|uniref:hypothetical protein n=1 Tax=Micromonospora TaxID=1873 RepID=UPI0011CDD4A9|nr:MULTISPECIES: hypothetical protein [Micromonospora]NES13019.1 hypothetical protein [Micromonospora sp. PPF5-17B]NES38331.1 hypothetical protein [Micromonospora solifontis]NES54944.1 hypothetical protein [Micromonospora sp. PPF5-6]
MDHPAWPDGTTRSDRQRDGRRPGTAEQRWERTPAAGLRVRLLSPGAQQTHSNPLPASSADHGPEWSGTLGAPWPALPGETDAPGPAVPDGTHRPRDPWPALPDDRELWRPWADPTDTMRLRRLDREQAGE